MLDESICMSPQKEKDSIHSLRLYRKSKRKQLKNTVPELYAAEENKFIDELNGEVMQFQTLCPQYRSPCETSAAEEQRPNETSIKAEPLIYGEEFNPFEDQMLLELADRVECANARKTNKSKINIAAEQGFRKCEDLFREEDTASNTLFREEDRAVIAREKEEVAVKVESHSENSPRTPFLQHKSKSVVELILDDFCSSPQSPEPIALQQLQQLSQDAEPIFQFRNIPLRTYNRRQIALSNFQKRLEEVCKTEPVPDDCLSNCSSSGLSVQEEQAELPAETAVPELNNSQRLRENLQSLSAYYTQLLEEKTVTDGEQPDLSSSPSAKAHETAVENEELEIVGASERHLLLIEEVITLRRKYDILFCRGSSAMERNLCGFSDDAALDSFEALKSPVRMPVGINRLQQNCAEPNTVTAVEYAEQASSTFKIGAPDTCGERDTQPEEESIFDGNDWNDDCDFFMNFKTPKVSPNAKCTTDSAKHCESMPAIAQERINKILEDFPELQQRKEHPKHLKNLEMDFTNIQFSEWLLDDQEEGHKPTATPVEKVPAGFKGASKQSDMASETAKIKAVSILTNLPDMPYKLEKEQLGDANCVGFRTASLNPIAISEAAKKRAAAILTDLTEEPKEEDDIACMGFQTASKKAIQISEASKMRAAGILENLPQLSCDLEAAKQGTDKVSKISHLNEVDQRAPNTANAAFAGFKTASRKTIKVSEAAKRKAACLLTDLPEISAGNDSLPINSVSPKTTQIHEPEQPERAAAYADELEDIVFSEWPLEETMTNSDALQASTVNKRKSLDDPNLTFGPAPKVQRFLTSGNIQHSPIKENASLRMVASELATHSPLSSRAIKSPQFISRKNLLSLSKVKKRRSAKNCTQLMDKSESTVTPTRERAYLEHKAAQTPETPNLHDFFDSVPTTSTPLVRRSERGKCRLQAPSKSSDMDVDFRQIKWDTANGSPLDKSNCDVRPLSTSKLSNASFGNITITEAKPTPKMRIERLSMYGKPPSISPIQATGTSACRPVGLRRSLLKK